MINHTNKPFCFKKRIDEQFDFYYYYNQKAWMVAIIFLQIAKNLSQENDRY